MITQGALSILINRYILFTGRLILMWEKRKELNRLKEELLREKIKTQKLMYEALVKFTDDL
jgi:hypothetical protein